MKIINDIGHNIRYPDGDLNTGPPEYQAVRAFRFASTSDGTQSV
jgi:hypothetical protein